VPAERKKILLRLDPAVHDALARWAADDLRSTNAQIEFLLRRALSDAGRMPSTAARIPRRGRPPSRPDEDVDGPDAPLGPEDEEQAETQQPPEPDTD
jgi:hypothetical protein